MPTETVDGEAIECRCPATGTLLGRVKAATRDDIDHAISCAERAQPTWARTTFSERRRVLRCLLRYVLDHQAEIARVACRDSGKTMVDAALGEILVTAEKLRWTIAHGEAALRPSRRPGSLLMCYKHSYVEYEPLGLVLACVSWNYPFHNVISPIIAALFAGDSIVVKASELCAWSAHPFVGLVRQALVACGQSADVVQCVTCWPREAEYMTAHAAFRHITFIGSREVGLRVAANAALNLTPCTIELGGKDAAIVLDAKQSGLASLLMRGVFQSAGQNCIGIERIIMLPDAYDALVPELAERVPKLRIGAPLDSSPGAAAYDVGAQVSDRNFATLDRLIADAVRQGARLLCGGHRAEVPEFPHGTFYAPTLIVDVTPAMAIAQHELFAPVAVCMRADTLEHAVEMANGTEYGLGASVFGADSSQVRECASRLRVGMVALNDFATYYMTQLPFGGVKGSGYGRFAGAEGLQALCNAKSISVDRVGLVRTQIPRPLDYPIPDKGRAWAFVCGLIHMGYEPAWLGKLWRGIPGLVKGGM